jgi:NADPH:quinone reductase-like Zn-dependent oxidoreductase
LGVTAVANAVPNGSADAIGTVRDGGHLATITLDPPDEQRGIEISAVIVQPDGRALGELAGLLAAGKLEVSVAATFPLEEAAEALAAATRGGAGGAVVLHAFGGVVRVPRSGECEPLAANSCSNACRG